MITLLAIMAAIVMPNLVSESKSREARQFFSKARNLMMEARSRAVADGITRTVRIDETGGQLTMEQVNPEAEEQTQDRTLAMPEGVTANAYRIGKTDSNSSEWSISFYADGKAKGGAVTFDSNGRLYSLEVTDRGRVSVLEGALPAVEDESWDAGGFEQRI